MVENAARRQGSRTIWALIANFYAKPWVPLIIFQKSESNFPRERHNILSFAPKKRRKMASYINFIYIKY